MPTASNETTDFLGPRSAYPITSRGWDPSVNRKRVFRAKLTAAMQELIKLLPLRLHRRSCVAPNKHHACLVSLPWKECRTRRWLTAAVVALLPLKALFFLNFSRLTIYFVCKKNRLHVQENKGAERRVLEFLHSSNPLPLTTFSCSEISPDHSSQLERCLRPTESKVMRAQRWIIR